MTTAAAQELLFSKMGFCGCTEDQVVIDAIIKILDWAKDMTWKEPYETIVGNKVSFYIIAGLLTDCSFIEHGTTIRCSWITEKGEEFLFALKELRKQGIYH